ncbi:IS3 family transposase [Glutamicibacter ardleyensis]|uniref:IS3 family transposase n=1 Tax=Glutamicibacter ardleyensis TaxID=225894 RepID=UPI003FD01FAF
MEDFGHLKSEMYHGVYFASIAELTKENDEYIGWYNDVRCHKRLQGMAQNDYRLHTLAVFSV